MLENKVLVVEEEAAPLEEEAIPQEKEVHLEEASPLEEKEEKLITKLLNLAPNKGSLNLMPTKENLEVLMDLVLEEDLVVNLNLVEKHHSNHQKEDQQRRHERDETSVILQIDFISLVFIET